MATPFRTPALPGAAFFEGLRDTAVLTIALGFVLKYTAVHGISVAVFGVAVASLCAVAERDRHVLIAVFMLFCCFEVAVLLASIVLGSGLLNTLLPWGILGENLVAALVMLGILFCDYSPSRRHLHPASSFRTRASGAAESSER